MTGSFRHWPLWGLLAICLLASVADAAAAGQVSVRALAEPLRVSSDGTVRLRVIVDGQGIDQVSPPDLAELQDWTVISGPSVSTQFRSVNGVSSSRRSFNWVLAPVRSGRLPIPSLTLRVAGANYATEPVLVEVAAAGASGGQDDGGLVASPSRDLFMRAVIDPASPYVGQPAVLSYRLYSRVEVAGVPQEQEVPTYPDFLARELEGPQSIPSTIEEVDGLDYRVYTIKEAVLIPTASGTKILPPVTFSVPLRSQGRQRRSFFFNMSAVEPAYRRTLPLEVPVRPLPLAGRPEAFSGAVGQFRMAAQLDRDRAGTGEAVALMVELQGSGNLKSSAAPLLEDPIDFTPYEAQEQAVAAREAGPLATARRWEYILVPHVPGEQAIPAVTFSYFDPDQGGYRELRADELILAVDGEPLARGAQGDVPARQDLQRLGADIDFIKPLPAVPRGAAASAYRGGLFWILLTAPPLLNLAALSYRWQSRRRLQRLPASRRRRARRQALRRLSRAQTLLADDRKQEFYGLLAQALTVFVADRFDVPATGLTYDRIATLLAGAQLDETCVRQYMAVLEACDCARFAPSDDDASQRQELAGRARRALDSLGDRL